MELALSRLQPGEWEEVAALIHRSTNSWYRRNLNREIFSGDPSACRVFPEVYETLDPGCCVVARCQDSGRLAGSCFYHPRETHLSLGIMNVHPDFTGHGVARRLLDEILGIARRENKPVRLVSSALNLDSFSLYTRAGFVPRAVFQDLFLTVPERGMELRLPEFPKVREAGLEDVPRMADLERELCGIRREKDFRFFVENRHGIWRVFVAENAEGELEGCLVSVSHPASQMLGPGVARTDAGALALIGAQLDRFRGRSPVFLVPADRPALVSALYEWGARNCELHFSQVLGEAPEDRGVSMPTFLPETA